MKSIFFAATTALALSMGSIGFAQDAQTLADIRQEAAVLNVELQKLKRELSTTGAPGTGFTGGSTLERVDLMDAQLAQMTGRLEQLEFRIDRIVKDGTNQLDDINFRLCELETSCDIAALPPLQPLGGADGAASDAVVAPTVGAGSAPPMDGGGELALAEQQDFDAAMALYQAGNFSDAAFAFQNFAQVYTGGFLTAEAQFMRGEALMQQGSTKEAARAYLDSFNSNSEGDRAPDALLRLGGALAALGQVEQGCTMLAELGRRFAGSEAAGKAGAQQQLIGCAVQ